jgi:hypothetical protein
MPTHSIARLLVLFLLWSGFGNIERSHAFGQSTSESRISLNHSVGQSAAAEGSVEHHHLDDLPTQAFTDPPTDALGLLPGASMPNEPWLKAVQPRDCPASPQKPPCLAGPLRPPCTSTRNA